MTYDRADWHYGGNYPDDLPDENGGTHIGMFLAWVILNGLEGEFAHEVGVEGVRTRQITGRDFLFNECDQKFWDDLLNEEGNAFAAWYYKGDFYLEDYGEALGGELPTLYHVADDWDNYDRLAPHIDRRFEEWKAGR